ncbi:uncharacterized protein LOC136071147 [Quercus suber]|uniref:uncharacterized protein LOC136071147 n=1 Tax=Quercus suber TaxID=58331 RepID=UPI0032DFB025
MDTTAFTSPISFKDKLLGEIPGAFMQAFNLEAANMESSVPDADIDDLNMGLISVKLQPETRSHIRAKWAHALIVKVFGRTVGFHFLHSRVMSMWKPAGRLDCVDLGKDFFLIRFGLVEDYDRVLRGGPWFVGGHYLTMRMWEPNFKPSLAACSLVAVWARLPELPFEYYELAVLKEIGNSIGPVLRIDANTASETRGRYARICIQVDLNKPLVRRILLEGVVQEIQYEGISSLCFSCGRAGHRQEACPYTVRASNSEQRQEEERGSFGREDSETSGRESRTVDEPGEEAREEFGPWMLVTRRKVGPNVSKSRFLASMTGRGADTSAFGSREGQVPRANHQPYKNDIKSHRGAFEGNGKKGRQVLSNCALEKSGVYSQDTANFGAEPSHASPSCQSLDHAFSFVTWAGSHPSSAGIKGSVCCPSKGVKSGSASDVRKSSRKGKSLASPHGRRKQTPVGNFS